MEVKRNINPQEICNKIREGNISALSKAITLCESNNDSDREISNQILANLKPKNKNTIRIGITGVPGACLLYTSPSPRDRQKSRMPSSA